MIILSSNVQRCSTIASGSVDLISALEQDLQVEMTTPGFGMRTGARRRTGLR
jgi:hypothetical protein